MRSLVLSSTLCLLLAGCAAPPRHPVPPAPPARKAMTLPRTVVKSATVPYIYCPDNWDSRTLRIWNTNDGYIHVAWKCEPGLWAQRFIPNMGWIWCNRMATDQTTNGWCVYNGYPAFGWGWFRLWSETNTNFTNAMTISVEMLQK